MSSLQVSNLKVSVEGKPILNGVELEINPGEIHAVMGPNGSGKSTLANTLAGHPFYEVTEGQVILGGVDVLSKSPDERANLGLFLAFQYPAEVAGVRVQNFLKAAYDQRFASHPEKKFKSVLEFRKHVENIAQELGVKKELLSRGLNEGFSGGEKKRLEILQMALLEPKFAILDETDSGLDVDAIKAVAEGVNKVVKRNKTGVLVITHYQRILNYLSPDLVHIMKDGKIVETGGKNLIESVESRGYNK